MNSTDDRDTEALLRRLFSERLVPLAEKLRARRACFFEIRPDPTVDSYYIRRSASTAPFFELEPERCAQMLRDLWASEGSLELVEFAEELLSVGAQLRQQVRESDEVSPFIYVMF